MLAVIGDNIKFWLCNVTKNDKLTCNFGYKLSWHFIFAVFGENDVSGITILFNNF